MYMKSIRLSIEDWWENEYQNYCLSEANVDILVFNNHKEGELKKFDKWDIKFKISNEKKISNWTKISGNTILIEQDQVSKDFYYEKHEKEDDTIKATIVSKNANGETGKAETNNNGCLEKLDWHISNDQSEYIITLEKKVYSQKRGITNVTEKMTINGSSKEFCIIEVSDSFKIEKTRVESEGKILFKIEKFGPDLEKCSTCTLMGETEKGKITRIRREEIREITWDKNSRETKIQDSIQVLGPTEELCKEIGKFKYITNNNNYNLDWIVTDKYFNGKANIFNNENHCFHLFKKTEHEVSDISEFVSQNNKWGLIENDSKNDKYNLQWIKKKPVVYGDLINNIVNKGLDSDRVNGHVNRKEVIEEFKQHVEFLFNFTGKVRINQFPQFRLFNENEENDEVFEQQTRILLEKIKENAEIADQIVKCQNVADCQAQLNKAKEFEVEAYKDIVRNGGLNPQDFFMKLANY